MAAIAQSRQGSGGCAGVAVVLAIIVAVIGMIALSVAVPSPSQPPAIKDIIPRSHAVENHGADALSARASITACKKPQSRWLGGGTEGVGWAVWCETGGTLCPGMYISAGGTEKTAFIRPCYQWRGQ